MSLTFGFYNSVNHDRKYNARDLSRIFDGIITDGVYHSIGEAFSVSAGTGMSLNVGSGRAWFNHTWTYNDTTIVLPISAAHQVYKRIDAVVLRVNLKNRENAICIKEGVAASNPKAPAMESTSDVAEYPLGYCEVEPGTTEVLPKNIRYVVGTSECPFVAGVQNGVDIDVLVRNWKDQFDVLFDKLESQITQAVSSTLIDGSVSFEKIAPGATHLPFYNIEVAPEQFEEDETYTELGYGYRASIPLVGVDGTMYPEVAFGLAAISENDFAPVAEAYGTSGEYNGGVYIYAADKPSKTLIIPTIICWRMKKGNVKILSLSEYENLSEAEKLDESVIYVVTEDTVE